MSFFGSMQKRRTGLTAADSLNTLGQMENFFQGGKRWTQGVYHAPNGSKCLVGAAQVTAQRGDNAQLWLRKAIQEHGGTSIEGFNDSRENFGEIAAVLLRAKQLAATCAIESARAAGKLPPKLPPPADPVLTLTFQPKQKIRL